MSLLLLIGLIFQFRAKRYIAGLYWLCVTLISVVGTLVSDNLTDNFGISLITTTIVFGILLAVCFFSWQRSEGTLSIHSIRTRKREMFYWLTILFTFALGTSAGDLTAERLSLGYLVSVGIFAAIIALVAFASLKLRLNAILGFWVAYILTRPLGASIGDYLSQAKGDGGLGLGTVVTSIIFLTAITATVAYLSITKKDVEGKVLADNS